LREHPAEGGRELRVAIVHQEATGHLAALDPPGEVPRLLSDPGTICSTTIGIPAIIGLRQ
jgi:hypothetical protein